MRRKFLSALAVAAFLTAPARTEDAKEDLKMLQGTWVPTAAEMGGQKLPDDSLAAIKLTLKDDRYTVQVGKATDQGTVKLDPAKKPKEMDITGTEGPNKGKTILAIYELSGDTLKVCYAMEGKERPTEFKTKPDTKLFLATYKREKP
jgi:uncharacterized protein (TIGR03067 family)